MSLKARRFGIELELSRRLLCVNNSDRNYSGHWRGIEAILFALYEAGSISRGWKLKVDTSCGGEVVSPILMGSDGLRQAAIICHSIQKYANLHKLPAVDAECGLHLHFDANDMKPRQLSNLFVLLHNAEPIIYSMYPNRSPEYCAPIEVNMKLASKFRDWTDVRDTWYRGENNTKNRRQTYTSKFINGTSSGEYYDGTRYHGFNIHCFWRQGTVEFRYGMGTLDPLHIKAYYEMCLSMVNTAMSIKKAKFSESMKDLEFKELMAHYSTNYRFRRIIRQLCKECSFSRGTIKLIMDMVRKNRPWLLSKRPMDGNVTIVDYNNCHDFIYKTEDEEHLGANGSVIPARVLKSMINNNQKIIDVILDYGSAVGSKVPMISSNPRYQISITLFYIAKRIKGFKSLGSSPDYSLDNFGTYDEGAVENNPVYEYGNIQPFPDSPVVVDPTVVNPTGIINNPNAMWHTLANANQQASEVANAISNNENELEALLNEMENPSATLTPPPEQTTNDEESVVF